MFHITGVKILLFFCLFFFPLFFFTSSCIHGNLIFHISFWFADVIARDAGSHATDRPVSLISLTKTNHKWRTNERNIDKFHGNWQDGLNLPIPMCKWSTSAYRRRQWTFQHGVKCRSLKWVWNSGGTKARLFSFLGLQRIFLAANASAGANIC